MMKMKPILAAAAILAGLSVSDAASAAPFLPFTINLSGTDANTATFSYTFDAGQYTVNLLAAGVLGAQYTAVSVATQSGNTNDGNQGNYIDYFSYTIAGNQSYWGTLSTRYATANAAYSAYSAQAPLTLSFNQATTVQFQIGDSLNSLGDNYGGTSLRVSAVPEPATWAFMILGFGAIGYSLRRRNASSSYFAA